MNGYGRPVRCTFSVDLCLPGSLFTVMLTVPHCRIDVMDFLALKSRTEHEFMQIQFRGHRENSVSFGVWSALLTTSLKFGFRLNTD
jgi:hypothetical protein